MAIAWYGAPFADEILNLGPLTLLQPLLQQIDVAGVIDRHLPPDPQLEFSHGQVLSLLRAARLSEPTALLHIALQTHQLLERLYRLRVPADAPLAERRRTAELLLRDFSVCGVLVNHSAVGPIVMGTRPSRRQRHILQRLGLPASAQILRRSLPPVPTR